MERGREGTRTRCLGDMCVNIRYDSRTLAPRIKVLNILEPVSSEKEPVWNSKWAEPGAALFTSRRTAALRSLKVGVATASQAPPGTQPPRGSQSQVEGTTSPRAQDAPRRAAREGPYCSPGVGS